jgi:ATP-dependent DNA ligase
MPANLGMRVSFPKRSTRHMRQATEADGANQSASLARSSLSSAGPTRRLAAPSRPLLLGYHDHDDKLINADRVGTGMPAKVLADLRPHLDPLARSSSPLSAPPPREARFGSPLVLSCVHWVKPQLVAEITYLTWTEDGLLRQTVYMGLRSDKPAGEVRRELPR